MVEIKKERTLLAGSFAGESGGSFPVLVNLRPSPSTIVSGGTPRMKILPMIDNQAKVAAIIPSTTTMLRDR